MDAIILAGQVVKEAEPILPKIVIQYRGPAVYYKFPCGGEFYAGVLGFGSNERNRACEVFFIQTKPTKGEEFTIGDQTYVVSRVNNLVKT